MDDEIKSRVSLFIMTMKLLYYGFQIKKQGNYLNRYFLMGEKKLSLTLKKSCARYGF